MVLIGAIRECLRGPASFSVFDVLGFKPLLVMILPAGGFFVIGFYYGNVQRNRVQEDGQSGPSLEEGTNMEPIST